VLPTNAGICTSIRIKQFAERAPGICADSSGNVFVTSQNNIDGETVYEFAHKGKRPIATLNDPDCRADVRSILQLATLPSAIVQNP
jgi:hypothetical protein